VDQTERAAVLGVPVDLVHRPLVPARAVAEDVGLPHHLDDHRGHGPRPVDQLDRALVAADALDLQAALLLPREEVELLGARGGPGAALRYGRGPPAPRGSKWSAGTCDGMTRARSLR